MQTQGFTKSNAPGPYFGNHGPRDWNCYAAANLI